MRVLLVLLILLIVRESQGIKVIQGKDVPQEYPIGKLMFIDFGPQGRMFFRTTEDLMGVIDPKTGLVTALFELEKDEKIVHFQGYNQVVIAKGRDINVFSPKDQNYVKLSYSEFLQKQNFKEILSYKRLMNFDYILTDRFLVKCANPMEADDPADGERTHEKYQIISEKEEETQTLIEIFLIVLDNKFQDVIIGLAFTKELDEARKMLCVRKMYLQKPKVTEKCTEIDPKQKIEGIIQVGPMMVVTFETYKIVLNQKMIKTHELKNKEMVSYIEELNIVGNPTVGKNLNSDDGGNTLLFYLSGNPDTANNLQFFEKRMLVKKDNGILTTIDKEEEDLPTSAYGYAQDKKASTFLLVVEFENKVKCYEVDTKEKSSRELWSFTVKNYQSINEGQVIQAKTIGAQEEEKLLKEIEEVDREQNQKEEQELKTVETTEPENEIQEQNKQQPDIHEQDEENKGETKAEEPSQVQSTIQQASKGKENKEDQKVSPEEVDIGQSEQKEYP